MVGAGLLAKRCVRQHQCWMWTASSRAKPAPTRDLRRTQHLRSHRSNVGAGLLAKAVCQATSILNC